MNGTLTHLLQRAMRLRQRFDKERARDNQSALVLLRLQRLLLDVERRMQTVLQRVQVREHTLRPALVRASSARVRT